MSKLQCFPGAYPQGAFWRWIVNQADETELLLYGPIAPYSWFGDEVTPRQFREELERNGKGGPITVRINSEGGDVVAASAIRAMLTDYPGEVTTRIDGLCASAAVMVALAGDNILMQDSAYMVIHNPRYTMLAGDLDVDTLLRLADALETVRDGMLDVYTVRTGKPREEIIAMLDAETWLSAAQAVESGFADAVVQGGAQAALPQNIRAMFDAVPQALLQRDDTRGQSLRDEIQAFLKGADREPEKPV